MRKAIAALLLAKTLVACSSSEPEAGKATFDADTTPPNPSISLRARALDGRTLTLNVVTHGVDELYGAAFRLSYDPRSLRFVELARGSAFSDRTDVSVLGRETQAGLLIGVATLVGQSRGAPLKAAGEATIATVTLAIDSRSSSRIDFVPGRSVALDEGGREIVLGTSGGRLSF